MSATNSYCERLGIKVPRLEVAKNSPDANCYSLLIVALLERGEPITLKEAARRFEEAGVARADYALSSLKRCRPGRPPIYRDGDLYALDPHDAVVDLWAFRLGLRPAKAAPRPVVPSVPIPLPNPDQALTVAFLDEAWREGIPSGWSAQRIAVSVLDAHGGTMSPDDVLAFVKARSRWSMLSADSSKYWRRGSAIRVREMLRNLGFEHGERRLAELGPPQKTRQLNRRGRTLKITTPLLIMGSCGISRPLGDAAILRRYLVAGEDTKLRRRLEADAKALYALYQYGRLHGAVRLCWGFLDAMIPAPWVHRDEPRLYGLMQKAHALQRPLEVVVGSAPGWTDPWSRVQRAYVERDESRWRSWLVDEEGQEIHETEVQLARLTGGDPETP